MKIEIPSGIKGKELTTFLLANKAALIAEKKSMPIKYSDTLQHKSIIKGFTKTGALKDSNNTEDPLDPNKIHVTAVANVFLYMDSQYDVLIPGCCKRTLVDRKGKFVQLHDHIYQIGAKIGEVTDVYTQQVSYSELGVAGIGSVESLIFEFDAIKSYNEQVFNQYKGGKIDQYSIGLQYVTIDIAINDPDSPKEIEFWNKYINLIINKDVVIEAGFFFVVSEIKLLENSAVLFGSNDLTFTMAVSGNTTGKSITKTVATYTGNDNAKSLMHVDKMMRRNNKSIETADNYDGTDADLMQACANTKYTATNSNTHLQQIKDKMVQGKSIENDPSNDIHNRPFDITKAIKETKFINLN